MERIPMTGQDTWAFFARHIESEVKAEIELERERKDKINRERVKNTLPPI